MSARIRFPLPIAVLFIAATTALYGAAPKVPPLTAPASPVASCNVVEQLGINTHIGFGHPAYEQFDTVVKPRLVELGIIYIRDQASLKHKEQLAKFNELHHAGIRAMLQTDPFDAPAIMQGLPGMVQCFELASDLDKQPRGIERILADQKALYENVKKTDATGQTLALSPELANPVIALPQLMLMSPYCDFATFRLTAFGETVRAPLEKRVAEANTMLTPLVKKEPICTAFILQSSSGEPPVSDQLAAKLLPRALLSAQRAGVRRTVVSDLIDLDKTHPIGLLKADGTPKATFHALKRFIAFFKDTPFPASHYLSFRYDSPPKTLVQMLFERSDGTRYLLLWLNEPDFNSRAGVEIPVAPKLVNIEFGTPLREILVYYPFREADKARPVPDTHRVQIPVGSEIICLKIVN